MSKNKFNKQIRITMEELIQEYQSLYGSLCYSSCEPEFSSKQSKKYIDSRFFKDILNTHNIKKYCYCVGKLNFSILIRNFVDATKFPLIQLLIDKYESYDKILKIKDVSPSYIKDLTDFKYWFKHCLVFLKDESIRIIKLKKENQIAEQKYHILADDFETLVNDFLTEISCCKEEDSPWTKAEPVWRIDYWRSEMCPDSTNNYKQVYQDVSYRKDNLEFNLQFTLNPDTSKLTLENLLVSYYNTEKQTFLPCTVSMINSSEERTLYTNLLKNLSSESYIKWQKCFFDKIWRQ